MTNINEEFNRMCAEDEGRATELFNRKIELVHKEYALRLALPDYKGFKHIDPKFEYLNEPEYLEFQKEALKVDADEKIAAYMAQLNIIEKRKLDRAAADQLKKEAGTL